MHPNEYQRGNLALLADGLDTLPVGEDGRSPMFGMQYFFVRGEHELSPGDTHHTCGTIACAVGWAPSFGIGTVKLCDDFHAYSFRELCPEGNVCKYLFGDQWHGTDNTPHGAAARIRHYLAHGLPDTWGHQMYGNAPLSYKVAT